MRDTDRSPPRLNAYPPALTVSENTAERQTDAQLVIHVRSAAIGASDGFAELVRRYQRMVYALALSLVREADAPDVTQEAFLTAFRNLDLLADPSRFGVWLRRIAFGVAIDHVRAERSRTRGVGDAGASWDESESALEVADPEPSALERLEKTELAERVLDALDRMPARYRVPLTLYHLDGLSHAHVARALSVPEGTVRSLVTRARRKLARILATSPEAGAMGNTTDVLEGHVSPRFLHVLNGDSVRMTLEHSDVPGAFAVWADVLHEGPVPRDSGTDHWRDVRSKFHAGSGWSYADAMRLAEAWDARLETYARYDEVVFWFEHDCFDQLLVIRHLDWFGRKSLGNTSLSLICIGDYPGFEPFHGLGQLDATQLASLLGTRQPVTAAQISLGTRAWHAFTASDPAELDALVESLDDDTLPFLKGALQRLLEEFPATVTGLPRTERAILEVLDGASMSPAALFGAVQRREERVFMGDTTFWSRVRGLASGPSPLVRLDVPPIDARVLPGGVITIAETGRDVLRGRADWVRLNGFDKWIGGVHLVATPGGDVSWRYDRAARRLIGA